MYTNAGPGLTRHRCPLASVSRRPAAVAASWESSTASGRKASRPRKTGRSGSPSSGKSGTRWADMCRMLAIVSRKSAPVDTLMAFRQLADTGRNFRDFGCPQPNPKSGHPDGWGIACVGQEGEFYARGPGSATADPKYQDAVRRSSPRSGPPLHPLVPLRHAFMQSRNPARYSPPFRREVDGRVMFFAHNGEIEDFGVR